MDPDGKGDQMLHGGFFAHPARAACSMRCQKHLGNGRKCRYARPSGTQDFTILESGHALAHTQVIAILERVHPPKNLWSYTPNYEYPKKLSLRLMSSLRVRPRTPGGLYRHGIGTILREMRGGIEWIEKSVFIAVPPPGPIIRQRFPNQQGAPGFAEGC